MRTVAVARVVAARPGAANRLSAPETRNRQTRRAESELNRMYILRYTCVLGVGGGGVCELPFSASSSSLHASLAFLECSFLASVSTWVLLTYPPPPLPSSSLINPFSPHPPPPPPTPAPALCPFYLARPDCPTDPHTPSALTLSPAENRSLPFDTVAPLLPFLSPSLPPSRPRPVPAPRWTRTPPPIALLQASRPRTTAASQESDSVARNPRLLWTPSKEGD